MLVSADGLGHTPQTLAVVSLSALLDSTGPKVSRAYQLLGDFHTLPLCVYFPSCCFLVTVSVCTQVCIYRARSHKFTKKRGL